jgi:hypothetical protein
LDSLEQPAIATPVDANKPAIARRRVKAADLAANL